MKLALDARLPFPLSDGQFVLRQAQRSTDLKGYEERPGFDESDAYFTQSLRSWSSEVK